MNKRDAAWMREHQDDLPPAELPNERGSRSAAVGGTANERTRDAKALALAAEHADAARDILDHPALSDREREIWGLYVDGLRDEELQKAAKCNTTTARKVIARVKSLMLAPGEAIPAKRAEKDLVASKDLAVDLEDTIALGAANAHRVITNIFDTKANDAESVENNERAVRTVLAIRKSEWEYLQRTRPGTGAPDEEVRKVAGAVKV